MYRLQYPQNNQPYYNNRWFLQSLVLFAEDLKTKELFDCLKELFPEYQKEHVALNRIYSLSSKAVHTAIAYPNYLI
jgi:hypothetical protein